MPCELEVRQQLSLMNRQNPIHHLKLDDYTALDQQIHPESRIQSKSIVDYRKRELLAYVQSALPQLMDEADLIDAL